MFLLIEGVLVPKRLTPTARYTRAQDAKRFVGAELVTADEAAIPLPVLHWLMRLRGD